MTMSALPLTQSLPSERRLTGGILFLLAGLSALGALATNIAAIGASLASILPLQPFASLAVILTAASVLALMVFLPVALRRPRAEPTSSAGVAESTGG